MRPPNHANVSGNKAAISITTTLYDRRALDCTVDKPLVNSLNNLTFLVSSSAKVRELLVGDGGIQRLVDILNECYLDFDNNEPFLTPDSVYQVPSYDNGDIGSSPSYDFYGQFEAAFFSHRGQVIGELEDQKQHKALDSSKSKFKGVRDSFEKSFRMFETYASSREVKSEYRKEKAFREKRTLVAWKWTLALQVLVLCGTRGNEKIRKKIVQSGIIPTVSTVLDNYLLLKSGAVKLDKDKSRQDEAEKSKHDHSEKPKSANGSPSQRLEVLLAETSKMMFNTISKLNGNQTRSESAEISLEDIHNEVTQFIANVSSGNAPHAAPRDLVRFARLFSESLSILGEIYQRNGPSADLQEQEAGLEMFRKIESNMSSVIREFNNTSQQQQQQQRSTPNPFEERQGVATPNGVASLAQNISEALSSLQTNDTPPPTLTESVCRFSTLFQEVLADASSNDSNGDMISLDPIVTTVDDSTFFWGVSSNNQELSLRLNQNNDLMIVCRIPEDVRETVVNDVTMIIQLFKAKKRTHTENTGLQRFSGKFLFYFEETLLDDNFVTLHERPDYVEVLSHMFKNLFFRDLDGNFKSTQTRPSSLSQHEINNTQENSESANEVAPESGENASEYSESEILPNSPYYDGMLVVPPREFYKGKIIPVDDDITWSLQLLAFISKYATMKDELQFSHIVPKLSLRVYPNDPAMMNFNENTKKFSFRDALGIELSNRSIVEDHFNKAWANSGNEFEELSKKTKPNSEFSFPGKSSFGYGMLMTRSIFGPLITPTVGCRFKCGRFDDTVQFLDVKQQSIEDQLFSLKINCDLETIRENIKALELTNANDLDYLFKLIDKYRLLVENYSDKVSRSTSNEDKTPVMGEWEVDDQFAEPCSTDESSGDEMESVEFGHGYGQLVQAINDDETNTDQPVIMGTLDEYSSLTGNEIERLNLSIDVGDGDQTFSFPAIDSGAEIKPTKFEKKLEADNTVEKTESITNNSAEVKHKIDKSVLIYQIDKQFEKILKINYKLTDRMSKIKYYEDKKNVLNSKWNYDTYDFDDTNYKGFLTPPASTGSPDPSRGFALNPQVDTAYRTLKENFLHLPFNYSKAPMIVSSIKNFHSDLPSINSDNFFTDNSKESEIFKNSRSTVVSKHDLDYSMIPMDFLNIFGLVEKFSGVMFNPGMNHWAGVIMRNSCRKDEQKGGIRQCGNTECGKWETGRRFSKCKRCKRAKYCSRECQLKAWEFHRYWCQPASGSTSSSGEERRHHHHHHRHHHDREGGFSEAGASQETVGSSVEPEGTVAVAPGAPRIGQEDQERGG